MPHQRLRFRLSAGLRIANGRHPGAISHQFLIPAMANTEWLLDSTDYQALRPQALQLAKLALPVLRTRETSLLPGDSIIGIAVAVGLLGNQRKPRGFDDWKRKMLEFDLADLEPAPAAAAA